MSTPAAFLSYARRDDDHSEGHLSELRVLLEREMQSITGDASFRIFQDQEDVAWGQQWQKRIDESIDGSSLLIPIITWASQKAGEMLIPLGERRQWR